MRNLSILVILAVALHVGTALAGVKKINQVQAQTRAKVMQHYNKMQRGYEKTERRLNSAKYLEDLNRGIPPRKGPNVLLKGKGTKTRIHSGSSSANRHLHKGLSDLSKPERALLKNLGWNQQMWKGKRRSLMK